jgi:hypothetical protein
LFAKPKYSADLDGIAQAWMLRRKFIISSSALYPDHSPLLQPASELGYYAPEKRLEGSDQIFDGREQNLRIP